MNRFRSILKLKFDELSTSEKKIVNEVWEHKTEFIQWPVETRLLWPRCVRVKYHSIPDEIKKEAKSKGIQIDSRSNGPAIMSFLLAGGKRPIRSNNQGWHIDHIYDGKFPLTMDRETLHAVKDGKHFTQSAGLVAIHPVAEALKDEHFYFAWLLRHESFLRFNYDPDMVFRKKIGEHDFKISRSHTYPPKKKEIENMIKRKLMKLDYSKMGRNNWIKGNLVAHIVRSSNFGKRIRIVWKETWKDDHAIVYDYSGARGPVCVVPVPVLFMSDFVKKKRRSDAYANSGYWWSQTFPRDHKLAKLVLSFEGRWDIL